MATRIGFSGPSAAEAGREEPIARRAQRAGSKRRYIRSDLGIGIVRTDDRFYPFRMQLEGLEAGGYIPPCFCKRVQKVLKTKKPSAQKRHKREKERAKERRKSGMNRRVILGFERGTENRGAHWV